MSTAHGGEKGFTLLEVLVALTIFAVGLLGVAGMQITAMKESTTAYLHTAAASVAQSVMEEILAYSQEDPFFITGPETPWDFDPDTTGIVDPKYEEGMGTYTATFTITRNVPIAGLARIVVDVRGAGKRATLTGFKSVL